MTGKTYQIQAAPPGFFDINAYPDGYFINIVITSSIFIAFALLLYTIRQLTLKLNTFKLNFIDWLLIVFYCLKILSALFGSKEPELSVPIELLSLTGLCAYFYVRVVLKVNNSLWKNLTYLFSALIIFETILGLVQLVAKSPLGKNIEYQVGIEYYGNVVGETPFTFRPVGTFDHANSLGIWSAAICIFLFAWLLKNKSTIILISFFSGFVLMITTISRSAWLGFAVGFIFLLIYFRKSLKIILKPIVDYILKWRIIIFPGIIILTFLFIIPRIYDSFYSFLPDNGGTFFRQIQISDALQIINLHPILGIGAGMEVYEGIVLNMFTLAASVPLEVHDWFLGIALVNGLPSLFVIIFFITYLLKKIFEESPNSTIFISIAAVVFCSSVAAIFQPYFNFGLILLMISLVNGGIIRPANVKKSH